MNYITTTKEPPSTRNTRGETTVSEQYLQSQNSKKETEITVNLCPK